MGALGEQSPRATWSVLADDWEASVERTLAELADDGNVSTFVPAPVDFEVDCACCETRCGDGVQCGDACGSAGGKKGKANPVATSHKGLFYANDFSYLNDPCYRGGGGLGDCLKLMPVAGGDRGSLDIGGQLRVRYHHERGMGRDATDPTVLRFDGTDNDFVLTRLRMYTDWRVNDWLRFYGEGIFADASDDDGTFAPRGIDRNWGDFLNLFVDVKLTDNATIRVGRQELLFGAQRLVSPLDWANTRRTFDGARMLVKSGDWTADVFYTWFVPVVPNELDEADYDQTFYGVYSTYDGFEHFAIDTYYLGYDNENPGTIGSDFSLHTLGTRVHGSMSEWLWELEGGPQFGRQSGLGVDHSGGFATAGLGRPIKDMPWSPTMWFYYDYASGNFPAGDFNRFNQLFPLAHKYFGFIDAVQRSNIEAPNMLLTAKPSKKVSLLMWYWHFMANSRADIVPSIGGTPAQSLTSRDLGDEVDLILKYSIAPRSQILFGWSHFWRGNKILATHDADFLYTEWTMNF